MRRRREFERTLEREKPREKQTNSKQRELSMNFQDKEKKKKKKRKENGGIYLNSNECVNSLTRSVRILSPINGTSIVTKRQCWTLRNETFSICLNQKCSTSANLT